MRLEQALGSLRDGNKIARGSWYNGRWIVMMPSLSLPPFSSQSPGAKVNDRTAKYIGEHTPLDSQPYISEWVGDGRWQPGYVPTQGDIFAEDWYTIIEGDDHEHRFMDHREQCTVCGKYMSDLFEVPVEKKEIEVRGKKFEADGDMVTVLEELNRLGLRTTQHCSGHGEDGVAYLSIAITPDMEVGIRHDVEPRLVIRWPRK